ncbi:MAG: hypothetical protein H6733_06435 [Alphaproteobacteria bacterium]|nr:hypothetical protein [Alphaproteobacteria bacterium]
MRGWMLGAVVLVTAGCAVGEKAFPKTFSNAFCATAESCDKATFNQVYSSKKDCVDTESASFAQFETAGCAYNAQQAAVCISDTKKQAKACDTLLPASCGLVYNCGGVIGFDTF